MDVVYLVIGRGHGRPGDADGPATGPGGLGAAGQRVRPAAAEGPVVFVAGGIGQTPFPALGKLVARPRPLRRRPSPARPVRHSATLLYGVRTAALAAGLDDFRAAGVAVELATDDGSAGHRGFVTDLLAARLDRGDRPAKVVGCGPPPMLAALARLVGRHGIPCDLSLENHMACGFGACFSCVAPIRQADGSTDLRRVCVEGPIFPAEAVVC